MIKTISNLEKYNEFINSFLEDDNYSDPMLTTEEQIRVNLYNSVNKKNNDVVGVFDGDCLVGLFVFLVIKEEKYLEMIVGLSKNVDAYCQIMEYLYKNYCGFKCDFVFNPGNAILLKMLKDKNAIFEKEQQKMVLVRKVEFACDKLVEEYSDNFMQQYINIHTKEIYWTAEKVIEAPNRFHILLAIENEEVVGYIDFTKPYEENEVYDLYVKPQFRKKGYGKALLSLAIKRNKDNGMMVLLDVDNTSAICLYTSLGFDKVKHQNNITAHLVLS